MIPLLLKQLCHQHGTIPEQLMKAKQEAVEPADVVDTELFINITKLYRRMFIVIDGLDECPEEKRLPILDFIVEVSSNTDSNIKVFVSSRKEPDISARFRFLNTPAIELETGKLTLDIRSFVQHEALKLRTESKLRVRDDALFSEIVQKLVEKSDGM
jgi:ATP/maltotriose-dependent transcriptional regulator MalT